MNEPEVGWGWRRMKRRFSSRTLVVMGLVLCAVIAIVRVIAYGDEGRGMMFYANERRGGPWTKHHY